MEEHFHSPWTPQGGSRTRMIRAFRMEGYAAVLSRDGQGGALLREVAKLENRRHHDRNLGEELLGCPTLECSCGSRSDHMHPRRGGNAGKEDSQCEPWRRAMVQAQISGGTGCVDCETYIAKAYQERE